MPHILVTIAMNHGYHGTISTFLNKLERSELLFYTPPEKKPAKLDLYLENIDSMVQMAEDKGVKVLVCGTAINIRDWMPLESVHDPKLSEDSIKEIANEVAKAKILFTSGEYAEARSILLEANKRDAVNAKVWFLLGQCERKLGNLKTASQNLEQALRYDALFQIRHISPDQNKLLGDYCRNNNILFDDLDRFLRSRDSLGLPGFNMFMDGCHSKLETSYMIAERISEVLFDSKMVKRLMQPRFEITYQLARSQLQLTKGEESFAYITLGFQLGFLDRTFEFLYLDTAFDDFEKAIELGAPPAIFRPYQAEIRIFQGRLEEAAELFTVARKSDENTFAAMLGQKLGDFVIYDYNRILARPARPEEMNLIAWGMSDDKKSAKHPDPAECPYEFNWDKEQSRFVYVFQ